MHGSIACWWRVQQNLDNNIQSYPTVDYYYAGSSNSQTAEHHSMYGNMSKRLSFVGAYSTREISCTTRGKSEIGRGHGEGE